MTKARSNAVAPAAKGDLQVGSGSLTSGVLGVGSDGYTLVADSSQTTGLGWQTGNGLSQGVINGAMEFWQRGTSFALTTPSTAYTADRWLARHQGTNITYSQQTSGLTGFQYSLRVQRPNAVTGTNDIQIYYQTETIDTYRFAGKTVTLSFYAKAGTNYSSASSILGASLYSGTGTNQNITAGAYTGQVTIASETKTLTTSWQRFSITGTVASTATQLAIIIGFTPTGTAGTNDWFEFTGVQLEEGSVATPFRRAGGTIQGELAACQRYYYRVTGQSAGQSITNGNNESTTVATAFLPFPVTMRTAPTALEQDGTAANYYVRHQATTTNCSSVPTFANGSKTGADISFIVASGLTVGNGNKIGMNSTSSYLGWSAEL